MEKRIENDVVKKDPFDEFNVIVHVTQVRLFRFSQTIGSVSIFFGQNV